MRRTTVDVTLAYTFVGLVTVLNLALDSAFKRLIKLECHVSRTKEKLALVDRSAAAQIANALLPIILVNADRYGFVRPRAAWFAEVGVSIVSTMVLRAPLGWAALAEQLYMRVARTCFSSGAVVQEELNRLYLGRDFDLASRYVAAQVTIFVCFGFSAALPVLLPVGALTFAVGYGADKYLLLRFHRTPPRYDSSLAHHVAKIMPYAALAHLGVAVCLWSNTDVTGARVLGVERFPAFLHAGPLYRLARVFLLSNTWPLVLLLVALAAHLALDATGVLWFLRCGASQTRVAVRKLAGSDKRDAPEGRPRVMDVSLTWTQQKQAFAKRKMAGDHMTYSYNLVENADLAHMFGLDGRHYHDRERACYGQDVLITEPAQGAPTAASEV